jgi:hypothetical protein
VVGRRRRAAGVPTSSQVGPAAAIVIQGTDLEDGHGHLIRIRWEAADASPAFDLTEPAAEPSVRPAAAPPIDPEPRAIPDRTEGSAAVPIGLRAERAIDSVLEGLAAEVDGWTAVLADPIAAPVTRPGHSGGPARLAATLIVAGSWGYRARSRGITSRRGVLHPRSRRFVPRRCSAPG